MAVHEIRRSSSLFAGSKPSHRAARGKPYFVSPTVRRSLLSLISVPTASGHRAAPGRRLRRRLPPCRAAPLRSFPFPSFLLPFLQYAAPAPLPLRLRPVEAELGRRQPPATARHASDGGESHPPCESFPFPLSTVHRAADNERARAEPTPAPFCTTTAASDAAAAPMPPLPARACTRRWAHHHQAVQRRLWVLKPADLWVGDPELWILGSIVTGTKETVFTQVRALLKEVNPYVLLDCIR